MISELTISKLVCSAVTFTQNMIFCLLPVWTKRLFSNNRNVSIAKCLSSGMLFSGSLLQLLSESEKSPSIDTDGPNLGFPLVHFIFLCGFMSMLIMEYTIVSLNAPSGKIHGVSYDITPRMIIGGITISVQKISQAEEDDNTNYTYEGSPLVIRNTDDNTTKKHRSLSGSDHQQHAKRGITAYIFFAIVIIESVIAGMTMGTQPTPERVWILLISSVVHDWAESLSAAVYLLGDMKYHRVPKSIYMMFILLSSATSIGIGIGAYMENVMNETLASKVSSAFMAYTAGTFIFISTVEIMAKELSTSYVIPDPIIENAVRGEDSEMLSIDEEKKKTVMSPSEAEQTRKEILTKLITICIGSAIPSVISFITH